MLYSCSHMPTVGVKGLNITTTARIYVVKELCDVRYYVADIRRSADNTAVSVYRAGHTEERRASLLAVPVHVGLAHPGVDLLHGCHGAVQRGVQEQDRRRHRTAGRRQRR